MFLKDESSRKKKLTSIESFIKKHRVEIGSLNGIVFAIMIIGLIEFQYFIISIMAFILGMFILFFSFRFLNIEDVAEEIPTKYNKSDINEE